MGELLIPTEIDDSLLFSAFLANLEADPLKDYRHSCEAAKRMIETAKEVEKRWVITLYWRAGNSSGKTAGGAALGVALARGLKELDSTPLPTMPVPNVGWVLVQTRLQQVDASQKAYLHWLGKWPHKISYVSGEGKGYIERIDVATDKCKHGMDARCSTCSRIMFHCAESDSSIGGRIHWAHADEIPPARLWDEVGARFTAGTPFLKFITATPLYRREWAWIAEMFKGCENQIVDGKMELRSTIFDNRFLPKEQAEAVVASWPKDGLFDARVKGEYVDTEGDCPFDTTRLDEWLALTDPPRLQEFTIMAEKTTERGRVLEPRLARVETWEDPNPEDSYLLVADPSTGVRSLAHDPAGFHVWSRRERKLVARFDDYLEPYGLGYLIGLVATKYNKALVDVDMTGGYGGPTITALSAQAYHNINRDYHEYRPGAVTGQLGFRITAENRSEIISAIQRAIAEDNCNVTSAAVISCLKGCTVDEKGKTLAAPGRHDEDMICMGRSLHLMDTMGRPSLRVISPQERVEGLLGRAVRGRFEDEDDGPLEDAFLE